MTDLSLPGFAVDDMKARAVRDAFLAAIQVARTADPQPADLLAGLAAAAAAVIRSAPRLRKNPKAATDAMTDLILRLAANPIS